MVKTIKKISYMLSILFLIGVVFILMAQKSDWAVNSVIVPIFLIIFILTALCMLIISISTIFETISKYGKKDFCKKFIIRWILSFIALYAAGFLKKDINILIILGSSFALSIGSYYFAVKWALLMVKNRLKVARAEKSLT